eukprot:GEMP01013736.1.p1 GENE.GEMP01013736.1~~GEMP01013736.1.p1  ORF type:complete len:507 (+),score=117.95 GEMP01013736.1:436-1956(+)
MGDRQRIVEWSTSHDGLRTGEDNGEVLETAPWSDGVSSNDGPRQRLEAAEEESGEKGHKTKKEAVCDNVIDVSSTARGPRHKSNRAVLQTAKETGVENDTMDAECDTRDAPTRPPTQMGAIRTDALPYTTPRRANKEPTGTRSDEDELVEGSSTTLDIDAVSDDEEDTEDDIGRDTNEGSTSDEDAPVDCGARFLSGDLFTCHNVHTITDIQIDVAAQLGSFYPYVIVLSPTFQLLTDHHAPLLAGAPQPIEPVEPAGATDSAASTCTGAPDPPATTTAASAACTDGTSDSTLGSPNFSPTKTSSDPMAPSAPPVLPREVFVVLRCDPPIPFSVDDYVHMIGCFAARNEDQAVFRTARACSLTNPIPLLTDALDDQIHNITAIRTLIRCHCDVNLPRRLGTTPLFLAVEGNHVHSVRLLLSVKANINDPTLLLTATNHNSVDIARDLLRASVDKTAGSIICSTTLRTALCVAAGNSFGCLVRLLLAANASVNTKRVCPVFRWGCPF